MIEATASHRADGSPSARGRVIQLPTAKKRKTIPPGNQHFPIRKQCGGVRGATLN